MSIDRNAREARTGRNPWMWVAVANALALGGVEYYEEARKPGERSERGMSLEHEELTGRIIGAAIEVHKALGPGYWSRFTRTRSRSSSERRRSFSRGR